LIARTLKAPKGSFFLFGPRGTGKSTWVRSCLPKALRIDLLKESTFVELAGHSERLEALADGQDASTIIIDEVQKLPSLLDEVHRLIESRGFRFALTGSSARKLRRAGVNLLAGRARTLGMHPFTPSELGARFDLKKAIRHGLLPSVWAEDDPADYLRGYVGTYLREEVHQEAMVRNISGFNRFLEAASFSQGSVLNMQAVAADCGINRKTIENHFALLEDLLLATRLPVFRRKATRKLTTHPKFFFFDVGVYRALRPRGPLDADEDIDGAAIETLLFESLRAENANAGLGYELFFWRTSDGTEVDFVLYGERGLHAFEVKRSSIFRETDLAGLRAFHEEYPRARGHLFYGGTKRYRYGQIEVVPLGEGLETLATTLAHGA
jgi:predicted AAA+ superfamily ATPase